MNEPIDHLAGGKQVTDPRLLPCPFCGGPASLEYFGDYVIFCTCGGGMNKQFHEYQDAITAWNKRAALAKA